MSTKSYKDTVFLPKTSFSMRADLTNKEPRIIEEWRKQDLDKKLQNRFKDAPRYTQHDGPPYANGHLHLGHALNKILKDVIFRSRSMMGYNVHYIHGWDCHGVPIEWKIEESYLKKKKNKDEVPVLEFRQECREFAQKWVDVQTAELQRLGVSGDWDNSYRTMTFEAEAQIIDEMSKFLLDGSLYKGAKPVMWSVV
jgi:isoleucyl-tRNA synthetase